MKPIILPFKGVTPKIHDTAFVAPGASVIGDVEIGENSSVWFSCAPRADVDIIRIGKNTNIQDGTIVHLSRNAPTLVGDNVTVGHAAVLHGCTIEDQAFVGMGATLLDGAVLETGSMLAAGSLLTNNKRVPAGQLWAGSPAKYMRDLTPEEIEGFLPHAANYVELAHQYKQENGF